MELKPLSFKLFIKRLSFRIPGDVGNRMCFQIGVAIIVIEHFAGETILAAGKFQQGIEYVPRGFAEITLFDKIGGRTVQHVEQLLLLFHLLLHRLALGNVLQGARQTSDCLVIWGRCRRRIIIHAITMSDVSLMFGSFASS